MFFFLQIQNIAIRPRAVVQILLISRTCLALSILSKSCDKIFAYPPNKPNKLFLIAKSQFYFTPWTNFIELNCSYSTF